MKDTVSHYLSPPIPLISTAPQAFSNSLTMPLGSSTKLAEGSRNSSAPAAATVCGMTVRKSATTDVYRPARMPSVLKRHCHVAELGNLGESVSEHCYAVVQGPPLPGGSGGPGESHPRAPTERSVTVSRHSALLIAIRRTCAPTASARTARGRVPRSRTTTGGNGDSRAAACISFRPNASGRC